MILVSNNPFARNEMENKSCIVQKRPFLSEKNRKKYFANKNEMK
jgi:hypothetical protein